MKNSVLNEEIDRILEIIGVSPSNNKSLILENPQGISKFIKSILNSAIKELDLKPAGTGRDNRPKFLAKGSEISKETYDLWNTLLNSKGAALDDFYDKFVRGGFPNDTPVKINSRITQLANALQDKFQKGLYDAIFKNWFSTAKENAKSEVGFYKHLMNLKQAKEKGGQVFDLEKEVEGFIEDPLERAILLPKIQTRLAEFEEAPTKFKTEVVKPIDSPIKPLDADEIKYLNQFLGKSSTFLKDIFKRWNKTLKELQDEVLANGKNYIDDIGALSNAPNPEAAKQQMQDLTNAYSIQISRLLNTIKMRFKDEAIQTLDEIGLPEQLKNKLKTDPDAFFVNFRQLIKLNPNKGLIRDGFENLEKSFLDVIKTSGRAIINLLRLRWGSLAKELFNINTPLGNWFWTKSWGGLNKMYGLFIQAGAGQPWSLVKDIKIGGRSFKVKKPPIEFWRFFINSWIWTTITSVFGFVADGIFSVLQNGFFKPLGNVLNAIICWIERSEWVKGGLGWCGKLDYDIIGAGEWWIQGYLASLVSGVSKGIQETFDSDNKVVLLLKNIPGVAQIMGAATGGAQIIGTLKGLNSYKAVGEAIEKEKEKAIDLTEKEAKKWFKENKIDTFYVTPDTTLN